MKVGSPCGVWGEPPEVARADDLLGVGRDVGCRNPDRGVVAAADVGERFYEQPERDARADRARVAGQDELVRAGGRSDRDRTRGSRPRRRGRNSR